MSQEEDIEEESAEECMLEKRQDVGKLAAFVTLVEAV